MSTKEKRLGKRQHSLGNQIAGCFIGLLLLSLFAIVAVNMLFLERYYVSKKTEVLENAFYKLESLDSNAEIPDDWQRNSSNQNLTWIIMGNGENGFAILQQFGLQDDYGIMAARLFGYIQGLETPYSDSRSTKILDQEKQYVIQKKQDKYLGVEYVEIWGVFSNGNYCLIRTPLESIRESAAISNGFYFYVGAVIIAISGFLIWVFTKRITRPISELTQLSRKMADLDFDARYECETHNEIDVLGRNFNKMSEQLEKTISELKTANIELQRDIENKIRMDKQRREFLGNVSHELKTPIALIQGYAEGLKENISDDVESREFYCDVIMDEAAKMNKLVKGLLTLNQLESGQDSVEMECFNVVEVICGVLEKSSIMIQQNEAQVIFQEKEPVYVWADEFKTEEVITNFFTNALNHLEGDREIVIRIRRESPVRISVFNTGSPIPQEDMPNLWDKFYKVDKARTREYGGSGIGLSIVKAIVDSHHQSCGVENYENGVEFWFTLEAKE